MRIGSGLNYFCFFKSKTTTSSAITSHLLLLTGIPGTGKTTIGNYLHDHHSFRHLDFEVPATLLEYVDRGLDPNRPRIEALAHSGQDIVITWGFLPAEQLDAVLALRTAGFKWIWLDGNRQAARRVFLTRGTVPESLLDLQMQRIAVHIDPRMDELAPRVLNSFDEKGKHRPLDDLARELLERSG